MFLQLYLQEHLIGRKEESAQASQKISAADPRISRRLIIDPTHSRLQPQDFHT